MCPDLVPTEKKKIERYIKGFPERIKRKINSLKPTTLHNAINMARKLVEVRLPGADVTPLQDVVCFGCGEKGHYKNNCPKARNQKNEGARVRAYVVVKNPQQNPNVVTGTFRLNDHYACILFDSGVEKNFVSFAFTPYIHIAPIALNTRYEVELADGKVADEKKPADIRIVCDFPEVFLDDLSGLPPVREIEFCIDLISGAFPIVRSPHRLAPSEILELSNQLKELQENGFIRPSHSLWGHLIDDLFDQLQGSPVEPVKNWKTLESPTEIRSFLGLTSYYQRFIKNLSKITKPLTLLTQKNKTYVWGDKQEEAFHILKEKLCNAPVLALPDGPTDFVVYCDASNQWFGCVLMQRGKAKNLEAQKDASKDFKALPEWLRGLETHFERRDDGGIYFFKRIWIPSVGGVRKLIMNEAHTFRYLVHSGADKMYYDLKDLYWWPGLLKQPEIPEWKWEKITIDLVIKLPKRSSRLLASYSEGVWYKVRYEYGLPSPDQRIDWDTHLLLVEFSYNNSYHKSIKCAPFEALYGHSDLQVSLEEIKVDDKLYFVEQLFKIMDRQVKKLKRSWIPIFKVRWDSRRGTEFTWEREDQLKSKYLHLFATSSSAVVAS
nr:hypothetical protein [Tanacetum cinerariifolium]